MDFLGYNFTIYQSYKVHLQGEKNKPLLFQQDHALWHNKLERKPFKGRIFPINYMDRTRKLSENPVPHIYR